MTFTFDPDKVTHIGHPFVPLFSFMSESYCRRVDQISLIKLTKKRKKKEEGKV